MSKKQDRAFVMKNWRRNLGPLKRYEASVSRKPVADSEYLSPTFEVMVVDGEKIEVLPMEQKPVRRPSRAKYCKKLKGPHKFIFVERKGFTISTRVGGDLEKLKSIFYGYELYRCEACTKLKHVSLIS